MIPGDALRTWTALAPALPDALYLGGGTALAVHLSHRESRDLDFFYHRGAVALDALEARVRQRGPFAVTQRAPGTLGGVFSETKLQFLHADEAAPQRRLEPTTKLAGINVAGVGDILAMKLKVIAERGELRDYYDLKTIEQRTGRTVEEGLGLFRERYGASADSQALGRVVRALGYLDDVDEDKLVPESKHNIAAYWTQRQPEIVRSLEHVFGHPHRRASAPRSPGANALAPGHGPSAGAGRVWIKPYRRRDGRQVRAHYRG
ncbi:MAG: nucleotidyl transferase AbiEii/AbiGii toxin family protein [Solirubrobacteraceae bacterium]